MKRSLLLLILFPLLFLSCREEEGVRVQLTPQQRDEFQAMATARMDTLRPFLDSICAATQEDRIIAATDSIVQRRLEEELRLRARLGQTSGR